MWILYITGPARKQLKNISREYLSLIVSGIEEIQKNPFIKDVVKIEDKVWRKRIGNYRIIFEIDSKEKIISILGIKRRTSKTY